VKVPGVIETLVAPLVVQLSVLLDPGFTAVGFAVKEPIVGALDPLCVPLPEPLPLFPLPLEFAELIVPPHPASPRQAAKAAAQRRLLPGMCRRRQPKSLKMELGLSDSQVVAMLAPSVLAAISTGYWPTGQNWVRYAGGSISQFFCLGRE
jgi:hypothetical protein